MATKLSSVCRRQIDILMHCLHALTRASNSSAPPVCCAQLMMEEQVTLYVNMAGACERIYKTPIPPAYTRCLGLVGVGVRVRHDAQHSVSLRSWLWQVSSGATVVADWTVATLFAPLPPPPP